MRKFRQSNFLLTPLGRGEELVLIATILVFQVRIQEGLQSKVFHIFGTKTPLVAKPDLFDMKLCIVTVDLSQGGNVCILW